MEPQYEGLPAEELARRLGRSERLFDVAYGALLRISHERFPHDQMRQAALDAIALIDRYPDDERFVARYTPA